MFDFLMDNKLLAPAQSGFKPSDSCVNQLLSINLMMYLKLEVFSWIYLRPSIKFGV